MHTHEINDIENFVDDDFVGFRIRLQRGALGLERV